MGGGIALVFARAGSEVVLTSRNPATLEVARARIDRSLAELASAGVLDPSTPAEIGGRIRTSTELERSVSEATLVLESVVEDLAAKHEVLARAERVAPVDAVIATDTSSIAIDELAVALARPERFAGMHWFNPPELVPLVEVVSGTRTAPGTAQRLIDWTRALGKRPVRVRRDIAGFVANRIQYAVLREAFALVQAGVCDYADVDEAVRSGLGRAGRPWARSRAWTWPAWTSTRPSPAVSTRRSPSTPSRRRRRLRSSPRARSGARPVGASTATTTNDAIAALTGRRTQGPAGVAAAAGRARP